MNLKKHKLSLSQEEFLKRMDNIFGDLYDFSESVYINLLTKVKCICPKHGDFEALPCHLIQGHGCPHCSNSSIMERKVSEILKSDGIEFVHQKNFEWMKRMKLDFFIPSKNIAIECQGIQHFKPIDYFGGEKSFKHQVKKDILKKKLCEEHNIKVEYINYDEEVNKRLKEIFT